MQTESQRTFHFESCLGKGGFGEVYLATAQGASGLRRRVAVKLLHGDLAMGKDAARRLRDEGRLLATLNHPNILAVDDLVMLAGRWGLVTEYVPGQDLAAVLSRGEHLPPKVALHIAYEVAEALEAGWYTTSIEDGKPLHLVHRDIKPANIRLARTGVTKLLDFGIALSESSREAHTQAGMIVGTVAYMAPERFLGGREEPAGDVYSLGTVLFEMLTRRPLVGDLSTPHLVALMTDPEAHQQHIQASLAMHDPSLPAGTRELLEAMLATDPRHRPPASQLVSHLERVFVAMEGGCLRSWARDRLWSEGQLADGPFVGRSLGTQTPTLDGTAPVAADTTAPPSKRGKGLILAGVALVVLLLLGLSLTLLCAGAVGITLLAG